MIAKLRKLKAFDGIINRAYGRFYLRMNRFGLKNSLKKVTLVRVCVTLKSYLDLAFWRTATSYTRIDVKQSTKEAKQTAYMTIVYHYLVYIVFYKLVAVKDSLLSKNFAQKLASAKTDSQLELLAKDIMETQLNVSVESELRIPVLEDMEIEVMHLVSYWNDCRVSFKIIRAIDTN